MRGQFATTTAFLMVMAIGFVFQAFAQQIEVSVPFAFRVGDRVYDADTYTIAVEGNSKYSIKNPAGHGQLLVAAIPEVRDFSKSESVTFKCYDGDCALMSIQHTGTAFTLAPGAWKMKPSRAAAETVKPTEKTLLARK